ncbi:ABC transporter family substrate-binding protein [Streptomyces odontomachi]|uniref:ABC transporter family substrate-binding protein n=1 Tax=Streptomyces odontomachi TaxID=2944940 RepID=UPI00210A0AF4|nr:ABC transporter family substrate-binding protein [Streptomyces sp. ODS25]
MSHDGARPRLPRSVAILTTGVLAVPTLAGCGSGHDGSGAPAAAQDVAPAARGEVRGGGTVRWAVDGTPQTLNTFQADADTATGRVAGAVLPALFRIDERGRAQRNADYLKSAEVVDTKPKQVVRYKLSPKAVWSDGRRISALDFTAQWHALSGKNTAFWTARNAGYDRIERITPGKDDSEVRVTFNQPYADWRSLFTPLYPKQVMGSPDTFNDGARRKLKATAGPFTLAKFDAAHGEVTLHRNPRWWGKRAKLATIVFKEVPRNKRVAALSAGTVDIADVDTDDARRIARAADGKGTGGGLRGSVSPSAAASTAASTAASATASAEATASSGTEAGSDDGKGRRTGRVAAVQDALRHFAVRKSFEPAYTQLALNGSSGPLADERVRRAVARAIDRKALARLVLKPLGLPVKTVGSHLALAGQDAYADGSGALGKQDTAKAQALLADAGWERGGTVKGETEKNARNDKKKEAAEPGKKAAGGEHGSTQDGKHPAQDGKHATQGHPASPAPERARAQSAALSAAWTEALTARPARADAGQIDHTEAAARQDGRQHPDREGAAGAYAPKGTAAPAGAGAAQLVKNGKPLSLRLVLPSGPGSEALRAVGNRIARMLAGIGIRTVTTRVADDSYFNDHIAAGQYDLALYSWPGSAFPATDARPIFAKPVPGADGSLNVEQNYTRVGTDHIDQLFDQALTELDGGKARDLIKKADARIWAEAGSIPLYQRPQLVAVRTDLANVGAFGFEDPRYEDIGFRKGGAAGSRAHSSHGAAGPNAEHRSATPSASVTPGKAPSSGGE